MQKISFNNNWHCFKTNKPETSIPVTIPHDAMLLDDRTETSAGGTNNGWFKASDYTYEKKFFIPEEYKTKELSLEFEGVYHKASIYINGKKIFYHSYGYTGFFVELNDSINYGAENTIQVKVINSDQPNCRWYSGTGIYRPVWLHVLPKQHILQNGIRITTVDYKLRTIEIAVSTNASGPLKIEILKEGSFIHTLKGTVSDNEYKTQLSLPKAELWEPDFPVLYTLRATFNESVAEEQFGIRKIEWNSTNGFCINGKRCILKGACIHHDNGILGACAYDFAEQRKIKILKENGYNAVRCAHNPCSPALLKACDKTGILVLDEYMDGWYIHKTKYDYADEIEKNYKEDIKCMINKDYNHPSVIMYSTGNEVSETAQPRGIALSKDLVNFIHTLDKTRPVTCGINIFFNLLSSRGFGVYSDKKADKALEDAKKKKSVGSEFYNDLAGLLGSNVMKRGATLHGCDVKTRDAYATMDVAGYNYGIFRYKHDLKKYPDRLILGSETFCSDAYMFYNIAKENPRLIGDFVWAGMDYLGEVGIGAWEYENYAPDFSHGKGWISAGSGRIDLTGKPLAEMKYTRVAFDLDKIGIGVIPVENANNRHSPSGWKFTNAIESWSWNGYNGKKTKVEVYAKAHHVSLFVNKTLVGTKKIHNTCRVIFNTTYYDGTLKAIAYDKNGEIIAQEDLKTAANDTQLTLEPEQKNIKTETDLSYIRLKYTDSKGTLKPCARGKITLSVENGTLLGFGSACPYYERSYLSDTADTYYGEALAIIKPSSKGSLICKAESSFGNAYTEIKVE